METGLFSECQVPGNPSSVRQRWGTIINMSTYTDNYAQLRFVTNSQSGMGLLKCGNVVIPFDNQIGKDTSLYKLYNTNLHEIAEQKKKEKLKKS